MNTYAALYLLTLGLLIEGASAGEPMKQRETPRPSAVDMSKGGRSGPKIFIQIRSGRFATTQQGGRKYDVYGYNEAYFAKPYTFESKRQTRSLLFSR